MFEQGLREICVSVYGRENQPRKQQKQSHGGMKMHPKFKQSQASNSHRTNGEGMKLAKAVGTDCEGPCLPV